MMQAVAVSDLHGNVLLYELLLRIAEAWKISSVFIAGDLAPSPSSGVPAEPCAEEVGVATQRAFFERQFIPLIGSYLLDHRHVDIYAIMGNDDRRANEPLLVDFSRETPNFHLVNDRLVPLRESRQRRAFFPDEVPLLWVAGYPYVPPGGGLLMDWVKYENRVRLRPETMDPCADIYELGVTTSGNGERSTIADDLLDLGGYLARRDSGEEGGFEYEPARTIHLFHAPPYGTPLDWCAPRGRYDFLKLSDHVGSVEIRRFITQNQPYLVLAGHCHESLVMGDYKVDLGETRCVNPGSQAQIDVLSLVQFDVYQPRDMKQFFIHAR